MSRPLENQTTDLIPGNALALWTGVLEALDGNVIGRRPDGSTAPERSAAMALPSTCPGYHASSTPATSWIHGISTAPPVLSTTTVRGFTAATAEISALASPGRLRFGRSRLSLL